MEMKTLPEGPFSPSVLTEWVKLKRKEGRDATNRIGWQGCNTLVTFHHLLCFEIILQMYHLASSRLHFLVARVFLLLQKHEFYLTFICNCICIFICN